MTSRNRAICTAIMLFVIGAAVASCGGGDSSAKSPSPAANLTPDVPAMTRNPVPLRRASEVNRADCPADWSGYAVAGLSVCYPAGYYAETIVLQPATTAFLVIRLIPGDPVGQTASTLRLRLVSSYQRLAQCEFEAEQVDPSAITHLAPYTVGGASGTACTAATSAATQFKGSAPTPSGAIEFSANPINADQLDLAKSILATIRFN